MGNTFKGWKKNLTELANSDGAIITAITPEEEVTTKICMHTRHFSMSEEPCPVCNQKTI